MCVTVFASFTYLLTYQVIYWVLTRGSAGWARAALGAAGRQRTKTTFGKNKTYPSGRLSRWSASRRVVCVFPGSSPVHWRSHAVPIGAAGASGVVGVRVGDGPGDGRAEGRWLRGETHGMMHATVSTSFMSFSPATFAASRL